MSIFKFLEEKLLLKKINERDEEAFSKCYDFYAPKIYRHAFYRLSSKELAEDITSEVFAKTWEFLTEPTNKIQNLKAFLYRVANNLIIDYYRSKERHSILIDEKLERNLGDGGRAEKKLSNKIELELVLKNLEKLNQEVKDILIWRYISGLSIGEIAELTGKTKNAIYVATHRGLKELHKIIKD
jgi:RNA polymerase sigma-70 factor (ECF subfamily)